MEATIEVSGLRKRFVATVALDGLSFTVAPGSVTGFVGPNGMDHEGILWMRGILRALAEEGRAVLVSSHLMSELKDTASHLVVIGRGRLVADTSVAALIAAASDGRVSLRTTARSQAATVLASAGATVAVTGS